MATQQELMAYFRERCDAERHTFVFRGNLTPRAEALVLTGLWANDDRMAYWTLGDGTAVRVQYGTSPAAIEIVFLRQGRIIRRLGYLEQLAPEQFVDAVEEFILQARREA